MSRRLRVPLAALAALVVTATGATAADATVTDASTAARGQAVALLVQYPDGTVATWCVAYRSGMSGADVLAPARPTYGSGPYAGFVLQITGQGTVPPTSDRYWAYWRSTTGKSTGYAYSDTGVTSTRPPARSVEAWVWTTGGSTTFPHRSYRQICPSGAA